TRDLPIAPPIWGVVDSLYRDVTRPLGRGTPQEPKNPPPQRVLSAEPRVLLQRRRDSPPLTPADEAAPGNASAVRSQDPSPIVLPLRAPKNPLTGRYPRCIPGPGPTSGRGKEGWRFRAGVFRQEPIVPSMLLRC